MAKFLKKNEVDAIQFTGANGADILLFVGAKALENKADLAKEKFSFVAPSKDRSSSNERFEIVKGDWVVMEAHGKIYVLSDADFIALFEAKP